LPKRLEDTHTGYGKLADVRKMFVDPESKEPIAAA